MSGDGEFISAAVKMFTSLGIVLIILMCAWLFIKRFVRTGVISSRSAKSMRVLSSCMLGMHKGIYLVEIAGSVLVIGVTNNSITLLDNINDAERVKALVGDSETKLTEGFASQFAKIIWKESESQKKYG